MLLRACLVASFALVAARAQVIPVAATSLAAAIQAAPPGAILLVTGTGAFVNVTVDKDVTIVCTPGSGFVGGLAIRVGAQNTLRLFGVQVASYVYWHYGGASYHGGGIHTDGNLHAEHCRCEELSIEEADTFRTVFLRRVDALAPAWVSNRGSAMYDVDALIVDSSFRGSYSPTTTWPAESGLVIRGTLRAERVTFTPGTGPASTPWPWLPTPAGLVLRGNATLANCMVGGSGTGAMGLVHDPGNTVIASGTTIIGGATAPPIQRLLPTIQTPGDFLIGTTSLISCAERPNTLAAVVLSTDLRSWSSALAEGSLWFGATPNWMVAAAGVSDAAGLFSYSFSIPNVPGLQHTNAWLTGVFVDPLPLRTTAPIGGMIR
jgi:hypothetical protein